MTRRELAPERQPPLARLIGVTKRFGSFVAVDNVSLEIEAGNFLSLLGPSGCGKSTTLRMLGGFEVPSEGHVELEGRIADRIPPHRRNTNLVFQQLALFPHYDVFGNIAFGLRAKGVPAERIRRRVAESLDLVHLRGFEARHIRTLSGGQKQRVAIARALVNEPALLLLDEPLGSLDLKLRVQMQLELKAIQHRLKTTFVYVTHDQAEALRMSDRIAVMNQGRLEQVGTADEIYERPATEFVASFIGDTNLIRGSLSVDGDRATVEVPGGLEFAVDTAGGRADRPNRVAVSIRPERVRVGAAAVQCPNKYRGRIVDVIHGGSVVTYEIAVYDSLVRSLTSNDSSPRFSPGDEVDLGWSPADAFVIPTLSDNARPT